MNAILSGRSARALILDGESLKSFDLDDPSKIVPRRQSDLPYLFGEAADLRILENTNIESVERELRMDCHFTWALDLTLISLDSELEDDIRQEALEELDDLFVDDLIIERVENVMYSAPLPDDADLSKALKLCDPMFTAARNFLERLAQQQLRIATIVSAGEAIPTQSGSGLLSRTPLNSSIQQLPDYRQIWKNDSLEELFMRVVDALRDPQSNAETNEQYFKKILQNYTLKKLQLLDTGRDPQANAEINEQNETLLRTVRIVSARLSEREKALFLSHLRGYTNEEIASAWSEDVEVIRKEMNALIAKIRYRRNREYPTQKGEIDRSEKLK
jgi:hypothetical protein